MNRQLILGSILIPLSAIAISGCDDPALLRRVADFDRAVVKSSTAIQTYYEHLNELERRYYFDDIRFLPGKKMALTAPGPLIKNQKGESERVEYQSGLLTRFGEEDIEARVAAIRVLGNFGEGLAALAASDAPERAGRSIEDIGTEIQSIDAHIKELTNGKGNNFAKYSGPISTIGGAVATHWMKNAKKDAIVNSIVESKAAITTLLDLLESELKMLDARVLKAQSQKSLSNRIEYYNRVYRMHRSSAKVRDALIDNQKRKAFLNETQSYAAEVRNLQAMEPQKLVSSMKKSYKKLIDYAEKPINPFALLFSKDNREAAQEQFDDLTKSIGAFLEDADRVAKAVKKLQE